VISVPTVSTQVLIGAPVVDIHDVRVGRIEHLIIDPHTGRVDNVILSLEESLVSNGRPDRVILPWSVLLRDWVDNTFALDVDTDLLQETGFFAYYTYPSCAPC
jgi:sporulation protein YlmC with PRC-barrel domain